MTRLVQPVAIAGTALPLPLVRRGKVRDVYAVGDDRLLLVATDRVSAFDVVMAEPVPMKGAVLTQLTVWWLGQLTDVPHHLLTAHVDEIVREVPALAPHRASLAGRAMLTLRTDVYPVECVVRGYLAGSGWKEYREHGTLAGEPLPPGLAESGPLPERRFTPATKAESGHDENISRDEMRERLGAVADTLADRSLSLYDFGRKIAERGGLILADTKYEFGERDGRVILIDEVMTPDSSRFWAADTWRPGTAPPSFDKQPLRDWLDALRRAGRWNGEAPPPALTPDVISAMTERYLEAYRRLTGTALDMGALA
jgi:phosphoribosylaminoimidazole-succinocarboxamide synthase